MQHPPRPEGMPAAPQPRLGELLEAGLAPQQTPPPVPPPAPVEQPNVPEEGDYGPSGMEHVAELPGALPVTWEVITRLRKQASDGIDADKNGRSLNEEDEQQLAQAVIFRIVGQWSAAWALENAPLSRQQTDAVRAAVFNAIYRSGALQPYLDDPAVENISIKGCDHVRVKYSDRPTQYMPPLAGTDGELREWVNGMAAHSGHGERQLSQARPLTNFRLPDGSRVAATLLTPRPSVVIRRHRVLSSTLEDLTAWGTVTPQLAAFLEACVRAKRNLLIAGDMGTGKTTLLRALGRRIPSDEDIVTLETDRELYLEQMPDAPETFAFEARESGGERTQDGKALGAISVADIFPDALRYDASRVVVGEVRSVEVLPMLDAMSAGGSGSMCTLHTRHPREVLERLLMLCNRAGLSDTAASRLVATSIDMVVYLRRVSREGRQERFVSHVLETAGVGDSGRPTFSEIFAPGPGGTPAVPQQAPRCLTDLVDEGRFDATWLQPQSPMSRPAGMGARS